MTRDSTETAAVETVVRDYIDGWHFGDEQRMARSFHDDLVKRTIGAPGDALGPLIAVRKTRMVQLTREGGGQSPGAAADVVHHLEGGIASAMVATTEYLDYLHLAKTDGTWRIVHDLFRQRS